MCCVKLTNSPFPDLKVFNLESMIVQRLPAFSAQAAVATVNSEVFLATGSSSNINSTIYKLNTTSNTLSPFQVVTTPYNKKWTSFTIGTTNYMIYANSYTTGSTISGLYSVSSSGLTSVQNITCNTGIISWEYFTYNSGSYLAGATVNNTLTCNNNNNKITN